MAQVCHKIFNSINRRDIIIDLYKLLKQENFISVLNREKLEAMSYKNPIRDAVLKQCPEVADGLFTPYGSNLSGDEILSILCEAICPKLTNPGGKITLFNNVLLCSFLIKIFNTLLFLHIIRYMLLII